MKRTINPIIKFSRYHCTSCRRNTTTPVWRVNAQRRVYALCERCAPRIDLLLHWRASEEKEVV